MKRVVFLLAFTCLLALWLPVPAVHGTGVAMGPAALQIDAVRGQSYQRTVTVFNPSQTEAVEYNLRVEGQASAWLSLSDLETRAPLQSLRIEAASSTYVLIDVAVPSDTPNGTFGATVYVETVPVQDIDGTGVSAVLQAHSDITIVVGGDQSISGILHNVTTRDIEAGLPLRLGVQFRNTGNVAVSPAINCAVIKDNATVAEFGEAETSVMAGTEAVIPVEWGETSGLLGDYRARVSLSLGSGAIGTREVAFKVLPPGSLTKTGEFTELAYEGEPKVDTTLKVQGSFKSTGQADCRAKLVLEVYRDGALTEALESEEALVPLAETSVLTAYLELAKSGEYALKAHVAYEGKQTENREISFTVTGGGSGMSSVLPFVLGGIGGALVLAVVAAVILRRRQSGAGARKQYAATRNGKRYAS